MKLRLVVPAVLLSVAYHSQSALPRKVSQGPKPAEKAAPSFALTTAQHLEQLKVWDRSQDEYLKVDNGASAAERQAALDGLTRVYQRVKEEKRETALSVAESLEKSDHWSEAEQIYLDLMKSDPSAREVAAERLERIEPRWNNRRWPEWLDELSLKSGRVLLVLSLAAGVALLVHSIKGERRKVQFQAFRGNTDDAAKQIDFWLERVRSDLLSSTATLPLSPTLLSSLPFIALPGGLAEQMPELDLEVGGTKIPFKATYDFFAKPRARVSGNWYNGVGGTAQASIEKRHSLDYVPFSSAMRLINRAAGASQDRDLQLFAYAVFIEASKV